VTAAAVVVVVVVVVEVMPRRYGPGGAKSLCPAPRRMVWLPLPGGS
jgi:hypothetical protein